MSNRVPRDLDTDLGVSFGQRFTKSSEVIVAHSTSSNLLPKILKEGLQRGSDKVWENTSGDKLFFEIEPTRTHYGENVYGWKSVQKHGGVPVTLYVKIKKSELRTDRDDADLGVRYQKNQKECTCDIEPENIMGLRFASIDVSPKDFMEFYEMFEDDKMSDGGEFDFEKSVFIHSAEKTDRDSIIENGLHASKNPVLITGIYTFPKQWKHHLQFSKKEYDYYEIRLKPDTKLFWTESDRPIDALLGNGNEEYNKVWADIISKTSLKNRESILSVITTNQKAWFKWKEQFSLGMDKYLKENNYAGIQEGGQVIITYFDAIESVLMNGKKIKLDNKMKMGGMFHGSTHDFNKFESNENINTGENENMYGWGIYFTDRKDKAVSYASKYITENYQNWMLDLKLNFNQKLILVEALRESYFNIEQAKKLIPTITNIKVTQQERKSLVPILEDFDKKSKNKRVLYSVTVNKDKENDVFLEWDKKIPTPYSYNIYEAIDNKYFKSKVTKDKKEVYQDLLKRFMSLDFSIIYSMLSYILGNSEKNASLFLLKSGVDGVKKQFNEDDSQGEVIYYVVFDENSVTIENKEKFVEGGQIFERGEKEDVENGLTVSNGQAGVGVYGYVPNSAMREYYTKNGEQLVYFKLKKGSEIIDLTKESDWVIQFIKHSFVETKQQMKFFVTPKVNKDNYQEFGTEIMQYIRNNHPNASAYIVPHKGYGIPTGKQVIINKPENIIIEKTKKMETNYALGGTLSASMIRDAISRSTTKSEELFSDAVNFDTRKGLNRSDKVVPKEVVEEIEKKGISLERLESLGLPIYKYQTQITIHGVFEGLSTSRVGIGNYKNLMLNDNKTLGVKYNAIDAEKKRTVTKALRFDNKLSKSEGDKSFSYHADSRGFSLSKYKTATDKAEIIKLAQELKKESDKIPSDFIGTKGVYIYSVFGAYFAELLINLKAIREENLWQFIGVITDGRMNKEKLNEMVVEQENKDKESELKREQEHKERVERGAAAAKELASKSPYDKAKSLPKSDEYILAFVGDYYNGEATIKTYSVFKNKMGRKVYYLGSHKDWSEVPTTVDITRSNNHVFNDIVQKKLTGGCEKGVYYLVNEKAVVKSMYEKPTTEKTLATKPVDGDVLVSTDRYELVQSKHTKTNASIFLLKLKSRVSREDYKTIESNVKAIRGYYSSFVTAFILKSAISENEIEKLLEGSSLEKKETENKNGGEAVIQISSNPELNEAAKIAVVDLVKEGFIAEKSVAEIKEGVELEEHHRETLEKVAKGDITVDEAIVETVKTHIEEDQNKPKLFDVYVKAWDLTVDEIKAICDVYSIHYGVWNEDVEERNRKIHFENLTQEQVDILKDMNDKENHAILYVNEAGYHEKTGMVKDEIEILENKSTSGETLYGANISYSSHNVFVPFGGFNTKQEIEEKAAKVLSELKAGTYKDGMSFEEIAGRKNLTAMENGMIDKSKIEEKIKQEYSDAEPETIDMHVKEHIQSMADEIGLQKAREDYPIVIEWSEGLEDVNIGIDYLHQLETKLKEAGLTETPNETYIKNKIWFKDYPHYVQIDNSLMGAKYFDVNSEEGSLKTFLNNYDKNFDWSVYEYGDKYKFSYVPEPKFKEGDLVRVTVESVDEKNDIQFKFVYGYAKPLKFVKDSESRKPQWTYDVKDKDTEIVYNNIFEFRMSATTEEGITKEKDALKLEQGLLPAFTHEEAKQLSGEFIDKISSMFVEYNKTDTKNKYLTERFEEDIRNVFYEWFEKVICRYPTMLTEWLTLQTELLPNYSNWLLNGFMNEEKEPFNLKQFFNTLMRYNIGKPKLIGLYELIPDKLISKKKPQKELDYDLDPSDEELMGILKPLAGKDDLRPALSGANFNEFGVTVTDAHKLLFIAGKTGRIGTYGLTKIAFESGQYTERGKFWALKKGNKYPAYEKVIPKKFSDVIVVNRETVEKIVSTLRTFKNASYYNINTKGCFVSIYNGESNKFNIDFLLQIFEAWLKIGFDKLEISNNTYSTTYEPDKVRKSIMVIAPDIKKFTTLKGSGSMLMAMMIEADSFHRDIQQTDMYLDLSTGVAETAGVTDNLHSENNPAHGTAGANDDAKQIQDIEEQIELLEETLNGDIKVEEKETIKETLELLKETIIEMKASNTKKFEKGGTTCGCQHAKKFAKGGGLNEEKMEKNKIGINSIVYYDNGAGKTRGEIISEKENGLVISKGLKLIDVSKTDVVGLAPIEIDTLFKKGTTVIDDRIADINSMEFYRYYPTGKTPFEISYDKTNSYGHGIYFLDNKHYYKDKFKDARLLTIRPNISRPMIFFSKEEYISSVDWAIKDGQIKTKDEFNRKMSEHDFDCLVIVDKIGTHLIYLSNDPELYSTESDIQSMDNGGTITPNKNISASIKASVKDVLDSGKYSGLSETEANFMYNNFKITLNPDEKQTVWISDEGFTGSMKNQLVKKNYIDESVESMMDLKNEYHLTDEGKRFMNLVYNRFQTRLGIKSGTDMFPETSGVDGFKEGGDVFATRGMFIWEKQGKGLGETYKMSEKTFEKEVEDLKSKGYELNENKSYRKTYVKDDRAIVFNLISILKDGGSFMEDADVNDLTIKNYKKELISLEGRIKYSEEMILEASKSESDKWAAKEYQQGIDAAKERIKEINQTLENISKLDKPDKEEFGEIPFDKFDYNELMTNENYHYGRTDRNLRYILYSPLTEFDEITVGAWDSKKGALTIVGHPTEFIKYLKRRRFINTIETEVDTDEDNFPYDNYSKKTVKAIITNEGLLYAVKDYMDEKPIHESDPDLKKYWKEAREEIQSFEDSMKKEGYKPAILIYNDGQFAIISDPPYDEIPVTKLSEDAQKRVEKIKDLLLKIVKYVGLEEADFFGEKFKKGGELQANDIPVDSWLQHKTTKVKVRVWNVDPQLNRMQIEDVYGNKNNKWYSASDWKLTPKPTRELKQIKNVFAEQGQDFKHENGGGVGDTDEKIKHFKNSPAYNLTKSLLDEKKIDYTKWSDLQMYDWYLKLFDGNAVNEYADGGGVEFIPYKDTEIMFEPNSKKYYSNDEEFDSLEAAQKYIDDGSKPSQKTIDAYRHGAMKDGGEVDSDFEHFKSWYEEISKNGAKIIDQRKTFFGGGTNNFGEALFSSSGDFPYLEIYPSNSEAEYFIAKLNKSKQMAKGGGLSKESLELLKKVGYTKSDIKLAEKFNKFSDEERGEILTIKDIPNIKSGTKLAYVYKNTEYPMGNVANWDWGVSEILIDDQWGEWGTKDGHPFSMESDEIIENKNNPDFKLEDIENEEYQWTLYFVKK